MSEGNAVTKLKTALKTGEKLPAFGSPDYEAMFKRYKLESGTIKKSMSFVMKFLPLLGAAGAGGGAAAGGAAAGGAGAMGQAAGAALNVASNLSESKRNAKAVSRIGAAMKHAKKIAAHDRMLENFNPRRFDKPATVAKVGKVK